MTVTAMRSALNTLRPKQWTKNLVVFAPLIFSDQLLSTAAAVRSLAAFAVFCLLSGAIYTANDLIDVGRDRIHATKRLRPLAARTLSPSTAIILLGTSTLIGLTGARALGRDFLLITISFIVLQAVYVTWTKHRAILDVASIAAGFVLRVMAGATVISVVGSPWLYLCAGLLALFLGLAKRRHEILFLGEESPLHRPALARYSAPLVTSMLHAVTAATVLAYAAYALFSTAGRESPYLVLTVPFVAYGLFRYLHLAHGRGLGGAPEDILLTDGPLIADIALWLASVIVIVHLI